MNGIDSTLRLVVPPFSLGIRGHTIEIRSYYAAEHRRISIVHTHELHNDTRTTGGKSKASTKGQFMQNLSANA